MKLAIATVSLALAASAATAATSPDLAALAAATSYNSPGRFYCVRIYNRELTAAEVAHNYEVDRRRFGSGNE